MLKKTPHPVDIAVGEKIKQRRIECGLSQHHVADALGITFQQIQKYETGSNRVSASKLYSLATVLNVDIGYFFSSLSPAGNNSSAENDSLITINSVKESKAVQRLVKGYSNIKSDSLKRTLVTLVNEISDQ